MARLAFVSVLIWRLAAFAQLVHNQLGFDYSYEQSDAVSNQYLCINCR